MSRRGHWALIIHECRLRKLGSTLLHVGRRSSIRFAQSVLHESAVPGRLGLAYITGGPYPLTWAMLHPASFAVSAMLRPMQRNAMTWARNFGSARRPL